MLPPHYLAKNPHRRLSAYIDVYLKEEIKEEALVRNLNAFQRFLEVAALTDGEMVNNNNIAQDCGVSANTVVSYFDILEDTLLGFRMPAYTKTLKRRLVQAPRFYYLMLESSIIYCIERSWCEVRLSMDMPSNI